MIQKLKTAIKTQLVQGATPLKLAQSLATGLLIGCFPILGFTTALAFVFGFVFKLNHVVVQTSHYLMYPVQILLIPLYIKVIGMITNVGDVPIRPDLILKAFNADPALFLKQYSLIGLYAVILWTVVSSVLFFVLQKALLPFVLKFKKTDSATL